MPHWDLEALRALRNERLAVIQKPLAQEMEQAILEAKRSGDSVGGVIECMALGLPAGLGAPFFDSVESVLSHMLFSVPAVKGVEFGLGSHVRPQGQRVQRRLCHTGRKSGDPDQPLRRHFGRHHHRHASGVPGGRAAHRLHFAGTADRVAGAHAGGETDRPWAARSLHCAPGPAVIEAAAAIVLEDLLLQRDGEHPAE